MRTCVHCWVSLKLYRYVWYLYHYATLSRFVGQRSTITRPLGALKLGDVGFFQCEAAVLNKIWCGSVPVPALASVVCQLPMCVVEKHCKPEKQRYTAGKCVTASLGVVHAPPA